VDKNSKIIDQSGLVIRIGLPVGQSYLYVELQIQLALAPVYLKKKAPL
jgi:hypothetical protein